MKGKAITAAIGVVLNLTNGLMFSAAAVLVLVKSQHLDNPSGYEYMGVIYAAGGIALIGAASYSLAFNCAVNFVLRTYLDEEGGAREDATQQIH